MGLVKAIIGHKVAVAVALVALVVGGYVGARVLSGQSPETRYVLAAAERRTIVSTVTGSGQVAASNQVEVRAKASGDITRLAVAKGQAVKASALLALLDASEAQKAVRDATTNLESAQLALEKLGRSATDLERLQADQGVATAREAKAKAEADLAGTYEDSYTDVVNAFLNLPTAVSGIHDVLFTNGVAVGQTNADYFTDAIDGFNLVIRDYRDRADAAFQFAQSAYGAALGRYQVTGRSAPTSSIGELIEATYGAVAGVADALRSATDFVQLYSDEATARSQQVSPLVDTYLASLNSYSANINANLASLAAARRSLDAAKLSISQAERSIAEKVASRDDLLAGADPLDVRAQEFTVQQRQAALADAREKLGDYAVRAPFDGVVAELSVAQGDSVSSGGTVATLVTEQKTATVSLNEVDVAKVELGQKVTLSVDAIEGLSITGQVADIDAVGTVSQGVVTYDVTVLLDTQDERVKSGMSVSASIITDVRTDVLAVLSAAVKSDGSGSYVEVLADAGASGSAGAASAGVSSALPPTRIAVEVGLSDDSYTEVASGLAEGDQVVVRTINGAAAPASQTQAPSLFGAPSGRTGGGAGAVRVIR